MCKMRDKSKSLEVHVFDGGKIIKFTSNSYYDLGYGTCRYIDRRWRIYIIESIELSENKKYYRAKEL